MNHRAKAGPRTLGLAAVAAALDGDARRRHLMFVLALSFGLAAAFSSVLLAPTPAHMRLSAGAMAFAPSAVAVMSRAPRAPSAAVE